MKPWLLLVCLALSLPLAARPLHVRAGHLLDVETGRLLADQVIILEGERILSVQPYGGGPVEVDWSGHTVLPGLIDLHTHLADVGQSEDVALPVKTSPAATALLGARNALLTLRAGFTTVRDVGTYRGLTDVALRNAINAGQVPGPRMLVAGAYLTCPQGGGEVNGLDLEIPPDMRLGVASGPEQMAEKAENLFQGGADFLKLIVTGAVLTLGTEVEHVELTEEEIRAAVRVAEAHGSYATAHAHGAAGIKRAIAGGVRCLEHASLIDDEGLRLAREHGVWLVMDIYNGDYIEEVGRRQGWPAEYLRKNQETTRRQREGFRKAVQSGLRLAYGTDAGVFPHGLNARQFRLMVLWGMTPTQAIQSATIEAARLLGREKDLGRIAPGCYADLVAVPGDPLQDITLLEGPVRVIQSGRLVP